MNPTATKTIRVPQPFATALLADLREPADDDERDSIAAEQIAYEAKIDATYEQWIRELDGPGDRALTLTGESAAWLHDDLDAVAGGGWVVEGLTDRLARGSTEERERVVEALGGWTTTMAQLDGLMVATMP